MEHQSKEVFGSLLEDQEFWKRPPEERVQIVDYAADRYATEDAPEDDLLKWSQNRHTARLAARLGPEGYADMTQKLSRRSPGDPLPDELLDGANNNDFIQSAAFPYGREIVLDPLGEDEVVTGMMDGPGTAVPAQIPTSAGPIRLKFLPIGSHVALDITTKNGTRRHKFDSYEDVPKSGLEMTRFLESNYAEDFGVSDGLLSEAGAQIGAISRSFAQGAATAVGNIPSMMELAIANTMHGEKGKELSRSHTIGPNGNMIEMPEELGEELRQRALQLQMESPTITVPGAGDGMGFGSDMPSLSYGDAFIQAHREHLRSMGDFEVTGHYEGDLPSTYLDSIDPEMNAEREASGIAPADKGTFIADAPFAVLEQTALSVDPDAENVRQRQFKLQPGDRVSAEDLLTHNIALQDAPKARELTKIYRKHLENVRAIDEVYGDDVAATLRRSREGFLQTSMNVQQDAAGVAGQMLPVLPAAIAIGPVAPGAGLGARALHAGIAMTPGVVTGVGGNMAETVTTVFQDNIEAGKSEADAILNATDAGMIAAAAAAPVDAIGDAALGGLFSKFGRAFRSIPPKSQQQLAKHIARMMDEAAGATRPVAIEAIETAALQMVTEAAGELTRASVADEFRENPDGFGENIKNALYEGMLAMVATGGMSVANSSVNTVTSALTKGLVDNRMEAAQIDAASLARAMRLPAAERDGFLRQAMDVSRDTASQGLPPASNAIDVPVESEEAVTVPSQHVPTDAEWEQSQIQARGDFSNAQVTTDESEVAALNAYGITPGDILHDIPGVEGPVRILGAPLDDSGQFAQIRAIDSNGQELSFPESSLEQGFEFASTAEDVANQEEANDPEIEIADAPAPPAQEAEQGPRVWSGGVESDPSLVDSLLKDFRPELSHGIKPESVGPNGFLSSPGEIAQPSIKVVMRSPEGEAPPSLSRNYETSTNEALSWMAARDIRPVEHQTMADFMSWRGISPRMILGDQWSDMEQILSNVPVFMVEGMNSGTAVNIRAENASGVRDAVLINKPLWDSKSREERSEVILHEALHSSIGDWQTMASSPLATSEMASTWNEAKAVGDSIFKAVKSAATPEAQSFRGHFATVFTNDLYSPENPHLLVEELMVRGLTNSRSRAILQMVDPDLKPIKKTEAPVESLWDRIVALFRRMVGWDGQKPGAESIMDAFMRLHQEMNAQRAPFSVGSYSSPEAARRKAGEMGLDSESYSIEEDGTSVKLMIEETGMSQIREAQKTLDAAIDRAWTSEEGESASEQLEARNARITAAQNHLSDLSEAFFGGMAQSPDAAISLGDQEQSRIADEAYRRAVRNRQTAATARSILAGPQATLSEQITDQGRVEEQYNRFAVGRGVSLWAAGIRDFPSWQRAMWRTLPNANLTAIWNNIESSIGSALNEIGANAVNAFTPQVDAATSASRRNSYNAALRSGNPEAVQTFYNEAIQHSRTKLSASSRASLFNHGPLAPERDSFISVTRNSNGFATINFDQEAYQAEYDLAREHPETYADRLMDLDKVPNAFREAQQRIDGVRQAKKQIGAIFTDVLSRMGIDRTGSALIWRQIRMSGDLNGVEAKQAIDAAIDRASQQFSRAPDWQETRAKVARAARQARIAFNKAHRLSPESILDTSKASDVAQAAKAKARYLGAHHGRNIAQAYLQNNTAGANAAIVIPAYQRLFLDSSFDLESTPGFDKNLVSNLLGDSLDSSYLAAFNNAARGEFLRHMLDWANHEGEALAASTSLWLGEPAPRGEEFLVGGVDFNGKTLFSGLIEPMARSLATAYDAIRLRDGVAVGGSLPLSTKVRRDARIGELRSSYDRLIRGDEGSNAENIRKSLSDSVLTSDEVFRRSFDKQLLDSLVSNAEQENVLQRYGEEVGGPVPLPTPGKAHHLLRQIQDARGGLKTNIVGSRWSEFSDARFDQPFETRDDRRDVFNRSVQRQEGFDSWNLQRLQTQALLLLASNDASRALDLSRKLLSDSVNARGYPDADAVSSRIEELLTVDAAAEKSSQLLSQRSLDEFLPRIEAALPISPQKARLALLDSKAEVVSLPSLIEQFGLMDESASGPIVASFLRGNTRETPVLLLDTSLMSPESSQAFKESALLSGRQGKNIDADTQSEGYQGPFIVVDVGPDGSRTTPATGTSPVTRRILAESVRDRLKSGDLSKATPYLDSLSESSVLLDHAIGQLSSLDLKTKAENDILATLSSIQERFGSFEEAGATALAIEVLSNPDFRQAISNLDQSLLPVPDLPMVQPQIEGVAKSIAERDYNDGASKFFDVGRSYEDIAESTSIEPEAESADIDPEDGTFNIARAFSSLPVDSIIKLPDSGDFNEALLRNSLQTLWSAGNYAQTPTFIDTSARYEDTTPPAIRPGYDLATAISEARTTTTDGQLNNEAGHAYARHIAMTGAIIRSVKARAGNSYSQWLAESTAEDVSPGAEVETLPGASPSEIAQSFKVKAMVDQGNPLAAGNYATTSADPAERRAAANEFAQNYWDAIFQSAEYASIGRQVEASPYASAWMKDGPIRQLADLAEFMMKPQVGRSVKAEIHSSIAKAFTPDIGQKAVGMRKMRLNFLHDEWARRVGKDMAIHFLTGSRFNPVSFDSGFNSMKRYAHKDAVIRTYGAGSPQTLSNIMDLDEIGDFGITGNRGFVGFRSKMIDLEDRWRRISAPMGSSRRGYVRASLVGNLTQFNLEADPRESMTKMLAELERGYANLLTNGKDARRVYKLRKVFREEMDRFLPLAREFAEGRRDKDRYIADIRSMLSPVEANWLDETRKLFEEIKPAMEAASVVLGRDMGIVENYLPLLNGRINKDSMQIDALWREPGQKVGVSRAKSMNVRFAETEQGADYILDLDGSGYIGKLRRDIYTLETLMGGMLLHEVLGTQSEGGTEYRGQIQNEAKKRLSPLEQAEMRTTVLGLRGLYDRTRTGFQSGLNVDNQTRRFLTTAQQVGAYKSLADLEQLPKQTIPGIATYSLRMAASASMGDTNHLRAFASVAGSLAPGKADLRASMTSLMKELAPAIYLRGFDGNAAFNERLNLELKDDLKGITDVAGLAERAGAYSIGALRTGARIGLDWTVGKPDSILTSRMFLTEYARQGYAAGLGSLDAIFEKSNWNPRWASIAKAKAEELMGSSALEERGTVMQMKGSTVSSEALATAIRAYGIHNISLAAHARALANEFQYAQGREKLVPATKLLEIGIQQSIFNLFAKPTRDLFLAQLIATATGKDRDDVYFYLLNKWPLDRRTKPVGSPYDWFQNRGWRTMFDMTPMLGAYGAALSLPVVNDLIREALTEGYGDHGLKSYTAKALNKPKYRPFHKGVAEHLVGSTGYLGVTGESLVDGFDAGMRTGEWGKVMLSQIAPRGIAARLNQDMKTPKKEPRRTSF